MQYGNEGYGQQQSYAAPVEDVRPIGVSIDSALSNVMALREALDRLEDRLLGPSPRALEGNQSAQANTPQLYAGVHRLVRDLDNQISPLVSRVQQLLNAI